MGAVICILFMGHLKLELNPLVQSGASNEGLFPAPERFASVKWRFYQYNRIKQIFFSVLCFQVFEHFNTLMIWMKDTKTLILHRSFWILIWKMFQHITNNKFYHKSFLHQIKKVSRQYEQYSNYLVHFVSGQLPPEENCPPSPPWLGLGFWSRLRLVLGLGGNEKIASGKNWPLVRVSFGVGG